jgi:hypothetical protein
VSGGIVTGFYKMREIPFNELLASQEGLCSVELVSVLFLCF